MVLSQDKMKKYAYIGTENEGRMYASQLQYLKDILSQFTEEKYFAEAMNLVPNMCSYIICSSDCHEIFSTNFSKNCINLKFR